MPYSLKVSCEYMIDEKPPWIDILIGRFSRDRKIRYCKIKEEYLHWFYSKTLCRDCNYYKKIL